MSSDGAFSQDPWHWFRESFAKAAATETFDASRAALATVDADGKPSVRFVLVKQADDRGFRFFTNRESSKARHLAAQPFAALAFHWSTTGEQVRAEGSVELLSDDESNTYFASRPRGSQLSAWTSEQSRPITTRAALEARLLEVEQRFAGVSSIARPPFWGGYRLIPGRIEFWRNQPNRLHDRWSFTRSGADWQCQRLQP